MFTGIVETTGVVTKKSETDTLHTITIHANHFLENVQIGSSISVNGTCLTVTDFSSDTFTVDIMQETLQITTLKHLEIGKKVNLERALTPTSELGGHFVTGHVDGMGVIKDIESLNETKVITIEVDERLKSHLMNQVSITVDGISLTIFIVEDTRFKVHIIPETLRITTLNEKCVGDTVNIETDMLIKYVDNILKHREVAVQ